MGVSTKDLTAGKIGWDSICDRLAFPSDEFTRIVLKDRLEVVAPLYEEGGELIGGLVPRSFEELVTQAITCNTVCDSDAQVGHSDLPKIRW
jgi:hypothetical protein